MWAESVYVFLCDCWQLQAPSLVDSPSDDALMTSASSNDWHNTSQKQLTMLQLSHRVLTATDSICSNNTQIIERRSYKGNHLVTLTKKYKMQQKNHNKTNIIQIWVLLPQFTRVYSGEWRRTSQHTGGRDWCIHQVFKYNCRLLQLCHLPPDSQSWSFTPLPHPSTTCANLQQNQLSRLQNIMLTRLVTYDWTNGLVENIMPRLEGWQINLVHLYRTVHAHFTATNAVHNKAANISDNHY